MKQAIAKIQQLRELKPELHISVDGGVNLDNAPELIAAIRSLQDCAATKTNGALVD
jgi:pentose-5-phosphate-3-epimerase